MRGRRLVVEWREDADELRRRYRAERLPELRARLHGLWLVRAGRTARAAAAVLGVDERTVQQWVAWYRTGGLAEVRRHRAGGRQGRARRLSPAQEAALLERAAAGAVFTVGEAARWVEEAFGVRFTYFGMRSVFRRLRLKKKVPRPLGEKASEAAQEAWKRGAWRPP